MAISSQITKVWSHNLDQELMSFDAVLAPNMFVSVDTEFPGQIFTTPMDASDHRRCEEMAFNINRTKVLQLGIALPNLGNNTHKTWEFNFHYDLSKEFMYNPMSIKFSREKGLDFEKLLLQGIDLEEFASKFARIIFKYPHLKWVTFHGLYDLDYVIRILSSQQPIPYLLDEFLIFAGRLFSKIVDMKYMAGTCLGLRRGNLGLERLASIMKVKRLGQAHHAGSDSLLISKTFQEIVNHYGLNTYMSSKGHLYSLNIPIITSIFQYRGNSLN